MASFTGFLHTETSIFHSLWPFREVVINGGFNFEWNLFDFLRLDDTRLRGGCHCWRFEFLLLQAIWADGHF